jgi:rare lipoprotein A
MCLWLGACAAREERGEEVKIAPPEEATPCHEVTVSYYGNEFAGHKTANGEIYDPDRMTAANRTLPFGAMVRFEYRGRSVTVRVNDRGPYVRGISFDLSHAAAAALDMIRAGHAHVRMCPG